MADDDRQIDGLSQRAEITMDFERYASFKDWLPQASKLQRTIIFTKLRNTMKRRGMTTEQTYKGLLNLSTLSPRVSLERSSLRHYHHRRSHPANDTAEDGSLDSSEKMESKAVGCQAKDSPEITALITNGCDDKNKNSARESSRPATPELLDDTVGNQSSFVCKIPRKAIMLNLNSYGALAAKRSSQQTRAETEIRIADSSVSDSESTSQAPSHKHVVNENVDDVVIVKECSRTSKIIGDVITIEEDETKHSSAVDDVVSTKVDQNSRKRGIVDAVDHLVESDEKSKIVEDGTVLEKTAKRPKIIGDEVLVEKFSKRPKIDEETDSPKKSSKRAKIIEDETSIEEHSRFPQIVDDVKYPEGLVDKPQVAENVNPPKKPPKMLKIVEDVTCVEGTIFASMSMTNSSQIRLNSEKKNNFTDVEDHSNKHTTVARKCSVNESSEVQTKRIRRRSKKLRLRRKFRQLFGSDLTTSELDEESAILERFVGKKSRNDLRVSLDSGVGLTDLGSDDVFVGFRANYRDEWPEESASPVMASPLRETDKLVRSMPLLDSSSNDTNENLEMNANALPDSSTCTDEKTLIPADSSIRELNNGKFTILITPVNMQSPDAFAPVSLEIDVCCESQVSTPTSTTGNLPVIETSSSTDDVVNMTNSTDEDLSKILAMNVFNESCSITLEGNTISIRDNTESVITPQVESSDKLSETKVESVIVEGNTINLRDKTESVITPQVESSDKLSETKVESVIVDDSPSSAIQIEPLDYSLREKSTNKTAECKIRTDNIDIPRDYVNRRADEIFDGKSVQASTEESSVSADFLAEPREASVVNRVSVIQDKPMDPCHRKSNSPCDKVTPIGNTNQAESEETIEDNQRSMDPPPPPPVPKLRVLHHSELGSRWCPTPISNATGSTSVNTDEPSDTHTIQSSNLTTLQRPLETEIHRVIQPSNPMTCPMALLNAFSTRLPGGIMMGNNNGPIVETRNSPQPNVHQLPDTPSPVPISPFNPFTNQNATLFGPIFTLLQELHFCIEYWKLGSNPYNPQELLNVRNEFRLKRECLFLELGRLASLIGSDNTQYLARYLTAYYTLIMPPERRILNKDRIMEILNLSQLPLVQSPVGQPGGQFYNNSARPPASSVAFPPAGHPPSYPSAGPPPPYTSVPVFFPQNRRLSIVAPPNVTVLNAHPDNRTFRCQAPPTILTRKQLSTLNTQIKAYNKFHEYLTRYVSTEEKKRINREKKRAAAAARKLASINKDKQLVIPSSSPLLVEALPRNQNKPGHSSDNNENRLDSPAALSSVPIPVRKRRGRKKQGVDTPTLCASNDVTVSRIENGPVSSENNNNRQCEMWIPTVLPGVTLSRNQGEVLYVINNNDTLADTRLPSPRLEDTTLRGQKEPVAMGTNKDKQTEIPISTTFSIDEMLSRYQNELRRLENIEKEAKKSSSRLEQTPQRDQNELPPSIINENASEIPIPSTCLEGTVPRDQNVSPRTGTIENEPAHPIPESQHQETILRERNVAPDLGNINEMDVATTVLLPLIEKQLSKNQPECPLIDNPVMVINEREVILKSGRSEKLNQFINKNSSVINDQFVGVMDVLREFDAVSSPKKRQSDKNNNSSNSINNKNRLRDSEMSDRSEASVTPGGSSMPVCNVTSPTDVSKRLESNVNVMSDIDDRVETQSPREDVEENIINNADNATTITMDHVAVIMVDAYDASKTVDTLESPEILPNPSILDVKTISEDVFNNLGDCEDCVESALSFPINAEDTTNVADDDTSVDTDLIDCFRCRKPSSVVCEQCCLAFYCSSECHEAHWNESHHLTCKPVPEDES